MRIRGFTFSTAENMRSRGFAEVLTFEFYTAENRRSRGFAEVLIFEF
jgi:hypothetical protein